LHIKEFAEILEDITDSARFLASLDVLDIEFSSGHSLELYIANTAEQRSKGLAHLSSIDADGMLFYYDTTSYRPFTMKDMKFNLDIGWYDEQGKLLDVGNFEAGQEDPIYARYGYRYVIETPTGNLPLANLKVK